MCPIDEGAELVRCSVKICRCKQCRSVITPTELAWKFSDGHDFEKSDSIVHEGRQHFTRSAPCPFTGQCADVRFINDLLFEVNTFPGVILPAIKKRIDDLGRAMRTIGLEAGSRVGNEVITTIKPKAILHSRTSKLRDA